MTSPHSISRRAVARGLTWSVPVVAATAAAPAFAASRCTPSLNFSGGLTYNFGTDNSSSTTQILGIGGETSVNNLPLGVTVTSVTYTFWVQNRVEQTSRGPGAFWIGNSTSDRRGSCTAAGCSLAWSPTAGSGFAPTVTNTANLVNRTYPDGVTRASWDLGMTWTATRSPGTYTPTAGGSCRNFTTGPSSRFNVTYTGVRGTSTAAERVVNAYVTVTANLSTGQVLTAVAQSR